MIKKKVVILGARENGHGKVVLETLKLMSQYKVVGFLDDTPGIQGCEVQGIRILGKTKELGKIKKKYGLYGAFPGVGDNQGRKLLAGLIKKNGLELINVIHPDTIVSPTVKLGRGIYLAPGVIINGDSTIKDCSLVNTGSIIDHDCVLEEGTFLGPGVRLAGRVKVGQQADLFTGCCVIPDVKIGKNACIAAGAVVCRNIKENERVAGVPAVPMKVKK